MPQLKNYREVGVFDLISAPLNPIGAFDAEQFKKDVRALLAEMLDMDLEALSEQLWTNSCKAFNLPE